MSQSIRFAIILNLLFFLSTSTILRAEEMQKQAGPIHLPQDANHIKFFKNLNGKEKAKICIKCYECHPKDKLMKMNHTSKNRCFYCHTRRI